MPAVMTPLIAMPGDPGWDDARRAWNLAVDQHPAAVAQPRSARDVADAVRFARRYGLRVADLIAAGATNRDAATALFVSVRTVETHVASIYRKLGVRTRAELARHLDASQ